MLYKEIYKDYIPNIDYSEENKNLVITMEYLKKKSLIILWQVGHPSLVNMV